MRYTKVSYERVRNLGNYENVRVSVEIEVEASDSLEAAYVEAQEWVDDKLRRVNRRLGEVK